VGVQEVRWDKETKLEQEIIFSYGKHDENYRMETGFFVHHRIVSAVKRAEFFGDRRTYIVPRGRWCNIIVLNVHTPS
jgi:hypothetical protein